MSDAPKPPFATVADVQARSRALSDADKTAVQALIDDASDVVMTACPHWDQASPATLRRVVCAMVKRALPSGAPDGAGQYTETTGPFSASITFRNPSGDLYLTRLEKQALGCGRTGAFEVDLLAERWAAR
ncbi:MAG: Gp19/Gp15/Gp42 family protein [Actinomycetaceae bacterium]|nr:Gp19/Gp15/Gp42 family protein [Actinomycetaceae bacterium]